MLYLFFLMQDIAYDMLYIFPLIQDIAYHRLYIFPLMQDTLFLIKHQTEFVENQDVMQ